MTISIRLLCDPQLERPAMGCVVISSDTLSGHLPSADQSRTWAERRRHP